MTRRLLAMAIQSKRVYEEPQPSDGQRILVDRLWPRGLSKEGAHIGYWAKRVAPSHELRRWYRHEPDKWPEFRRRYFAELQANPDGVAELVSYLSKATVTFVFSSRETKLNNAAALKEYVAAYR